MRESYDYVYDHLDRVHQTYYHLNNDASIERASVNYDDFGRVAKKTIYNKVDSVVYSYNIRNQLTRLQSFGFTENLFYTSCQHPFFTPCYNGNLAAQTWSYGSHTNGYFYSYDNRNRLSMATGMVDENYYDYLYDESFRYDKQGNILNVERFDHADIVDFLSCTYDGN